MNKDRIQIDGVWYVKEKTQTNNLDTTEYEGKVYESGLYCFDVTRIKKDDKNYYKYPTIKFTDKRHRPWREEEWDNNLWFLGVLDDDPESMKDVKESMCSQGIDELREVVGDLLLMGWIER